MAKKKAKKKAASKKKSKAVRKNKAITKAPDDIQPMREWLVTCIDTFNDLLKQYDEADKAEPAKPAHSYTLAQVKVAAAAHKKAHGDEDLKNIYIEIGKAEKPETTTGRMLSSVPEKNYAKVMKAFDETPEGGNEPEVTVDQLKEALKELPKKVRKKLLKESRIDKSEINDLEESPRFHLMEKIKDYHK